MKRTGKTLLEMMIVMSMLSSILLLCGQMLVGMFRAEAAQTEALQRVSAQQRLADRVRADVHSANAAKVETVGEDGHKAEQLVLSLPDGRTANYAKGVKLTRTVQEGDKRISYDAFPIPEKAVRFEVAGEGKQVILTLLSDPPALPGQPALPAQQTSEAGSGANLAHSVRIEATVGFDARDAKEVTP